MHCTLMHRTYPVVVLELDNETGYILKIHEAIDNARLPIGVSMHKGIIDRASLNQWWQDRAIPSSRSGIREALKTLGVAHTKMLLMRCYGLSLSDQYWMCPDHSQLTWEAVNFFHNEFSDDIGDVLFGTKKDSIRLNFSSPDNTSDGNLKKRWKIIDQKRCLVKGGSNPFQQQPFNEVIASKIATHLGIQHIPYTLLWNDDVPYSVCENLVSDSQDLVPAWRIFQTQKQSNHISVYQHFLHCCSALHIQDATEFLNSMIVLDFLIANEDRHFNNFGVLRDVETLQWIGFAPIYDSGSSLGYDKTALQICTEQGMVCKPFKNSHAEQLKLVSDMSWLNLAKLPDLTDLVRKELSVPPILTYVGEERAAAIAEMVRRRTNQLAHFANEHIVCEDNLQHDVTANIATTY